MVAIKNSNLGVHEMSNRYYCACHSDPQLPRGYHKETDRPISEAWYLDACAVGVISEIVMFKLCLCQAKSHAFVNVVSYIRCA